MVDGVGGLRWCLSRWSAAPSSQNTLEVFDYESEVWTLDFCFHGQSKLCTSHIETLSTHLWVLNMVYGTQYGNGILNFE